MHNVKNPSWEGIETPRASRVFSLTRLGFDFNFNRAMSYVIHMYFLLSFRSLFFSFLVNQYLIPFSSSISIAICKL